MRRNEQGLGGIKQAEVLEQSLLLKSNSNSELDDRVWQSIKEGSTINYSSLLLIVLSIHIYVV
jgi:predicted ribosome quality control (RQC) complex YloA/Tae2 family protein